MVTPTNRDPIRIERENDSERRVLEPGARKKAKRTAASRVTRFIADPSSLSRERRKRRRQSSRSYDRRISSNNVVELISTLCESLSNRRTSFKGFILHCSVSMIFVHYFAPSASASMFHDICFREDFTYSVLLQNNKAFIKNNATSVVPLQ